MFLETALVGGGVGGSPNCEKATKISSPHETNFNFKKYTFQPYHFFNDMTLQDHLNDKSNIILLFTTRLTNELIEFWNDDYNFECSLRLLNDLSLQQKISSITKNPNHQQQRFKYKQLLSNLFIRYTINSIIQSNDLFKKIEFDYNEFGKPILPYNFQFNISSSNDIIALIVEFPSSSSLSSSSSSSSSLSGDRAYDPIGIDLSHSIQNSISNTEYLEQFKPIFDDVYELPQIDNYFKFNHFWTLKESFTKLIGSGLNIELSDFYFIVDYNDNEFSSDNEKFQTSIVGNNIGDSWMYYSLNWFDKILINIDKLELAKNQFITALNKKEFYCRSSILDNGNVDESKLPVIITIINQNKNKSIQPIELRFEKLLSEHLNQ